MKKFLLIVGVLVFVGDVLLLLACGLSISWLKTIASGLLGFCGGFVIAHARHCTK